MGNKTTDEGRLLDIQKFCILSQGIEGDIDNIEQVVGEHTCVF